MMNRFQPSSVCRVGMRSLCLSAVLLAPATAPLLFSPAALAQTGGQAGIQGTVTDSTGAVIPDADVTITNQETKVVTKRKSSSSGLFEAAPLIPGTYTVEVSAPNFQTFRQENLTIDALKFTGLNPKLTIGSADQTVTVSAAPPALETTNAALGGVIENDVYESLPIPQNGQQRDPTAFATLIPGAQGGARAPIIGGTGNYLAELSVDGLPLTTINQQGDNRAVLNTIPIEAIDQFQVLTSTPPVEYQGAGLLNFTLKSGTAMYHGIGAAFFRNTIFDTWGYTSKFATGRDALGNVTPARKPYENQNEIVGAVGGPIPFLKNKGFFFISYDRFHGRNGITPGLLTVATTKMRQGDFSELLAANGGPGYAIYDPTSQAVCTANSTTGACRYQFGYGPGGTRGPNGNPVRTAGAINVIPANEISPIAQYMQSFLPAVTNNNLTNNVLTGVPTGYDNWEYAGKLDFDLTPKQRLSTAFAQGKRLNVPYTVGANPTLPQPYTNGAFADVAIHIHTLEHAWAISDHLANQFRFGYVNFGGPPVQNVTTRDPRYAATSAGITNLPPGLSSNAFPGAAFSGANAQTTWTANGASAATYTSVAHTFTIKDNLSYILGAHSFTFGAQYQVLQINASTYDGASGIVPVTYAVNETAGLSSGSYSANSGYAYASYLLGAPQSTSLTIQSFGVLGGRYKPFAPYVADTWKITPTLTLDLGLRWDYLPTYTEAKDRWSFLNPNLTNAITGNLGQIQFAGNHGAGVSCQCRTPVNNYFGNYGPRVGFAWQVHPTTVFRGGASILYSHGGGVGGRAGAATGGGQLGYSVNPSFADSTNGPAFYLNNSSYFQTLGLSNTRFGGPTYTLPTPLGAVAAAQTLNTGNYLNSNGSYVSPGGVTYVDPYLSGRAPTIYAFNFGFQQALTNSLTVTANYAGTIAHFLLTGGSNARGYWANQMNPAYTALLGPLFASDGKTPLLNAQATAANIAIAQRAVPGLNVPSAIAAAGAASSSVRIQQLLVAFPQYASTTSGNVTDIWGQNVGNNSYNSFQLSLAQRPWKGLSYTVNWTYSKNIGDDGTFRSGFAIPAAAMSNGTSWSADRVERSYTTVSVPENLAIFGYYNLPFGKNGYFGGSKLASALLGGFQFSEIFRYTSGTPVAVTWACSPTGATGVNPGNGQCMPDLNPNYNAKSARINGSIGGGLNGGNLAAVKYIDSNAFQTPSQINTSGSGIYRIGAAPRTAPFNLRNPGSYNLDASLKRSFPLTHDRFRMTLQADAFNVLNNTVFGSLNASWPSTAFGTVSSVANTSRRWQFSGRVTF